MVCGLASIDCASFDFLRWVILTYDLGFLSLHRVHNIAHVPSLVLMGLTKRSEEHTSELQSH